MLSVLLLVLSVSTASFAQPAQEATQAKAGPRRQLATIIFAGLGGAVLGLSTLSFYGRPQERLSNIAIGFAIGVIAGTIFVTYQTATKPREFYGLDQPLFDPKSDTQRQGLLEAQTRSTPTVGLQLNF